MEFNSAEKMLLAQARLELTIVMEEWLDQFFGCEPISGHLRLLAVLARTCREVTLGSHLASIDSAPDLKETATILAAVAGAINTYRDARLRQPLSGLGVMPGTVGISGGRADEARIARERFWSKMRIATTHLGVLELQTDGEQAVSLLRLLAHIAHEVARTVLASLVLPSERAIPALSESMQLAQRLIDQCSVALRGAASPDLLSEQVECVEAHC